MAFFLHQIFPLVKARWPEVALHITGKTNGVPVERLPLDTSVILTGYLDDVRPAVAQSWACVVPLRVALGTPVVSSSKGAEGLEVTPGGEILIADEPTAFADTVLRLLDDPALRAKLATNGQRVVRAQYGWDQIGKRLDQLLHQVVRRYRH